MMHSFSKRLDTHKGFLSFYFNGLTTEVGVRYHVSVVGKGNKVYIASMEKKADQWVLVNPAACPHWMVILEKTFERVIIEHTEVGSN
jgi:hypothetical protein